MSPKVVVCLGATAAQSLFGAGFRFTQSLGVAQQLESGVPVVATYHPSAALRGPDHQARERARTEIRKALALATKIARRE